MCVAVRVGQGRKGVGRFDTNRESHDRDREVPDMCVYVRRGVRE